jgi:hypothetical protein
MIEWDGYVNHGKTKRGDEIMRVSKNGNIHIVYSQFAVQGKYSVERLTTLGYWDRFHDAKYSSDSLSEVEQMIKYAEDKPLEV